MDKKMLEDIMAQVSLNDLFRHIRKREKVMLASNEDLRLVITDIAMYSANKNVYNTIRSGLKITEENVWYYKGDHGFVVTDLKKLVPIPYYRKTLKTSKKILESTELNWLNSLVFVSNKLQYVYVAEDALNVISIPETIVHAGETISAVVVNGRHLIAPIDPPKNNKYLQSLTNIDGRLCHDNP
ncbi:hypothetical protein Ga0466249_002879 [Sporomusaceae bacterium BoRhaA]|uniref:hypothetical protein n=1 Tax=Pelorhabdus rhamnosifermentans TaxID=2772457 RepID=UPI001C060016|nr:hypothetical protein [Pelorhabdus rhamnosifermentans]MBU2701760.1 hypothetical protein [Pelorhabdus rhamnosifermentans]